MPRDLARGLAATVLLTTVAAAVAGDAVITPLANPVLREVSGVAAAVRHDGVWLVADSGNRPRLLAVSLDGRLRQQVTVNGVRNHDWEALASFQDDRGAWLVIGDIGDNRARRSSINVHVVPEPGPVADSVDVAATLTLVYPDGARDAEALAVDPDDASIYILTKRDRPPRLYRAPLAFADRTLTLAAVGTIATLPDPTAADLRADPKHGAKRSQPVGLDISADGRVMAVGTYKDVYLYRRAAGEAWAAALTRHPVIIDTPQLAETQAVTFFGESLLIASEGRPATMAITSLP